MSDGVRVRGAATAEELAVVLALLSAQPAAGDPPADGYAHWRTVRRQALRQSPEVDGPS
jgi:hypothetical protein